MIDRRSAGTLALVWLALCVLTFAAATPRILDLGLYYDEAFLAQQARGFVEPERAGIHPGSVREIDIAGRPFPLRNAAYLGALKSQLLIPAFFVFGADPMTLRLATLATACLSVLLAMLWTARLFGTTTGCLTGLLLVTDPGFYFFAQFEWGPYTTNLLCRTAGLWLVTRGGRDGPTWGWLAGGFAFGLGIYSRADFALIVALLAAAVAITHRKATMDTLRNRPLAVGAALLACALGASPTLRVIPEILATGADIASRGDLGYRLAVLQSVLDGSHFHRLIAVGGRFEQMFAGDAPRTLQLGVFALALCAGGLASWRSTPTERRAFAFVALVTVSLGAAMLAVPGAVRAHHMLNVQPFVQLTLAAGLIALARADGGTRLVGPRIRGIAVAVAVTALVLSNLYVIAQTRELLAASDGGRFSRSIYDVARRYDETGTTFVSLDWGFHEPLLFLTSHARSIEPIWTIPRLLRSGRGWRHVGNAQTVYLVHDEAYDLFGMGPALLRSAQQAEAEGVTIEWLPDDRDPSFAIVRLRGDHSLEFDGAFHIRMAR